MGETILLFFFRNPFAFPVFANNIFVANQQAHQYDRNRTPQTCQRTSGLNRDYHTKGQPQDCKYSAGPAYKGIFHHGLLYCLQFNQTRQALEAPERHETSQACSLYWLNPEEDLQLNDPQKNKYGYRRNGQKDGHQKAFP